MQLKIDPRRRKCAEINVGPTSAFRDPGRKLIEFSGIEVGVFKLGGEFFAYEKIRPHLGGPACQGKIIAKVEEEVADDRTSKGLKFSETKINMVCPWHGFEFDIRTGCHHGNPRYRLNWSKRVRSKVRTGPPRCQTRGEEREEADIANERRREHDTAHDLTATATASLSCFPRMVSKTDIKIKSDVCCWPILLQKSFEATSEQ